MKVDKLVVPPPPAEFKISLTASEAKLLYQLMGAIGGGGDAGAPLTIAQYQLQGPTTRYRTELTDALYYKLQAAGISE